MKLVSDWLYENFGQHPAEARNVGGCIQMIRLEDRAVVVHTYHAGDLRNLSGGYPLSPISTRNLGYLAPDQVRIKIPMALMLDAQVPPDFLGELECIGSETEAESVKTCLQQAQAYLHILDQMIEKSPLVP